MAYSLTDIVNEFLVETDQGQARFAKYYQLGVACLRAQNMDLSGFPKIVSLEVNSDDTIDIPVDYMNYSRIAICGTDGQLHSLGRNDNLCLTKEYNDCGEPSYTNSTWNNINTSGTTNVVNQGEYAYAGNIRNGEVMGRFFGIGGGNNANGYYRIDVPAGKILLGGGWSRLWTNTATPCIVLEYLADIEASGDDYAVHPFLIETVKDYIFWKSISRDRNRNMNEKQQAMLDYQQSERLSRIRFNSRTGEEWTSSFRAGNKAAVKW